MVVALDEFPQRWIMVLDDGSGATLEIVCPRDATTLSKTGAAATEGSAKHGRSLAGIAGTDGRDAGLVGTTAMGHAISMKGVDLGCVVKAKGGIGEFRDVRQMMLERISACPQTRLSSFDTASPSRRLPSTDMRAFF